MPPTSSRDPSSSFYSFLTHNTMSLSSRLARLLGLDDHTVESQVWPSLDRLSSEREVREYLSTFLGDSRAATVFADDYVRSKWGSKAKAKPPAPAPLVRQPSQLPQARSGPPQPSGSQLRKQTGSTSAMGLSAEARKRLDALREEISELEGRGEVSETVRSECFCQARIHDLSPHAPLCASCGLILCIKNRPMKPCPSCGKGSSLFQGLPRIMSDEKRRAQLAAAQEAFSAVFETETERICRYKEEEAQVLQSIRFTNIADRRTTTSAVDRNEVLSRLEAEYGTKETESDPMSKAHQMRKEKDGKLAQKPKAAPHVLRLDTHGKRHKVQTVTRVVRSVPAEVKREPLEVKQEKEEKKVPEAEKADIPRDPECYIDPYDDAF